MSKRPQTPSQGGLFGVAILFCVAAALAGAGLEFLARGGEGFWIGARPGGAAALGAAAAVFAVICARLARWLLARKAQAPSEPTGERQDAGADS